MNDGLDEHQKQALDKALQILGEHFDRSVVITEWEPRNGVGETEVLVHYQGGKWACVGLLEGAKVLLTG